MLLELLHAVKNSWQLMGCGKSQFVILHCAPVATSCLINHGNIVCSSFIMLDIATIDKVQLPIVDQLAHQIFCGNGLLPPPSCEEGLRCRLAGQQTSEVAGLQSISEESQTSDRHRLLYAIML